MGSLTVEGTAGPRVTSDGADVEIRLDRQGGIVSADGRSRYAEGAGRGQAFAASTGTAGVAPGTALSTTPPLALWNPPNSGVNLEVLRARVAYVSGTIGLGVLCYAAVEGAQAGAPTGGTVLTPRSTKLTGSSGQGKAFQGATLAATPTLLLPFGTVEPFVATDHLAPVQIVADELAGEIVVPPGSVLVLQEVGAAGSTPLFMFGLTWQEVPV